MVWNDALHEPPWSSTSEVPKCLGNVGKGYKIKHLGPQHWDAQKTVPKDPTHTLQTMGQEAVNSFSH